MFYLKINDDLKLALAIPSYAEEIFKLIDNNRPHLKEWLDWVDDTKTAGDVQNFIKMNLAGFSEDKKLLLSIIYKGKIAGTVSFNEIDRSVNVGEIGYWLAKEYNGLGIMLRSVKKVIDIGFNDMGLNKIEIHAVTENQKSRAIPEKLGFKQEGTFRSWKKMPDGSMADYAVYGLLKSEYKPD